jgi:hypothetical protein
MVKQPSVPWWHIFSGIPDMGAMLFWAAFLPTIIPISGAMKEMFV